MASDPATGVFVLAFITPKADKFDEVIDGLKTLAKGVEDTENDCLFYHLFGNKEAGKVVVVEKYKDFAALKAHTETEHYKRARAEGGEGLEKEPEIVVVNRFGGFQRS